MRMQQLTVQGVEWKRRWTLKDEWVGGAPRGCREEVVGIFGGGELGWFFFASCFAISLFSCLLGLISCFVTLFTQKWILASHNEI